jgi:hypothetical protein
MGFNVSLFNFCSVGICCLHLHYLRNYIQVDIEVMRVKMCFIYVAWL